MTCAEFQRVLPYIIESGGNLEEEDHLRSCAVCTDLVADLKYIAEQAKLLVPMEDPDPRVWSGIQGSLQREGLVKGGPLTRSAATWRIGLRLTALVALAVLGIVMVARRNAEMGVPAQPAAVALGPTGAADPDDARLLAAVANREPILRAAYEDNLRDVNAYIEDARQRVARYPEDEAAQEHLMQAYDQKAVLYEMAISQSLQ